MHKARHSLTLIADYFVHLWLFYTFNEFEKNIPIKLCKVENIWEDSLDSIPSPTFTFSENSNYWRESLLEVIDSYSKWIRQKCYQFFIKEKLKKTFYFLTCILPNYVPHEITKEFWKSSHFENMTAGFILRS